jgi:PAS domain S-box-containing protein
MARFRDQDDVPRRAEVVPGKLEAALARADATEAKYDALVGRLRSITYTEALDDGRMLSVSPQVEVLLGYTQDEWMADPLQWVRTIHAEDRDRVLEACWESNRTEQPFICEYRVITRDGRVLWLRDEAEVVRGSRGQRLCWQGVMLDISAEKEAEGSTSHEEATS